jgi:hypothetical protein
MSDPSPITPPQPQSPNPPKTQGPNGAPPPISAAPTAPKTLTFLGMQFDEKQTKQLWDSILKTVSAQIQKDKEKSVKQIKNFGKEPSDPDYRQ